MLTVGDPLPDLTLPVQRGIVRLAQDDTLRLGTPTGRWRILFYWPQDFTFVCPTEVVGYGALKGEFAAHDADLLGASTDAVQVHFAWRRSDQELAAADFPWIGDADKVLAHALGIVDAHGEVSSRATFIVDPANVIQHVTVNGINVGRNPYETLRVLAALQTNEPCPCNWQEGEPFLRPAA